MITYRAVDGRTIVQEIEGRERSTITIAAARRLLKSLSKWTHRETEAASLRAALAELGGK